MQPLVIDIYHGDPVQDFAKVKASGIVGVIHKASQGGAVVDQTYSTRRKMALAQGLLWGAYHFFDFSASPEAQADHFLSVADADADTLVALDWENVGSQQPSVALAQRFLGEIDGKLNRKAIIYSGNVAKEQLKVKDPYFGSHRLWLCQYGANWKVQESWSAPWLWQNNGDSFGPGPHTIPGVAGLVDNNTIVPPMTVERLIAEWAAGASSAAPLSVAAAPIQPATAAAPASIRQSNITATCFGGAGDRQASAYGGVVDPNLPGVALPFHFFSVPMPKVKVIRGDKSVICEIVDVGPHNTADRYWSIGRRPQAEYQAGNHAGIDMTPAVFAALGIGPNDRAYGLTIVDWEFSA